MTNKYILPHSYN